MSAVERRPWVSQWRRVFVLCSCLALLVVGLVSASPRADGPVVISAASRLVFLDEQAVASPGAFLLLAVIALFL